MNIIGILGYEFYDINDKIENILDLEINNDEFLIEKIKKISNELEISNLEEKTIIGINVFHISVKEYTAYKIEVNEFLKTIKDNKKKLIKIFEKEPKLFIFNY